MKILNASQKPETFYGLHMVPGVAEYSEVGKEPYRIYIGEETIKNMDPSFKGCPVYVQHVDEVNLKDIEKADGFVIRSFYNKADGKHWCEFIVITDKGHQAINNGWKLSNAYIPKTFSNGGLNHGVEYSKEVTSGEYEHLAIVPNPRYEESIILTAEEFKNYNSEKEVELLRVANEKKGAPSMKFWKKSEVSKVENATELEALSTTLPKSKIEITLGQLVNEADEFRMKMKEPQMANGEHHVMVGEEKMTVNDLLAKHAALHHEMAAMKEKHGDEKNDDAGGDDEEALAKAKELEEHEKKEIAAGKKNDEKPDDKKEGKKKENEETEEEKEAKAKKKNAFDSLKNAPFTANPEPIGLDLDRMARGKARYGSSK